MPKINMRNLEHITSRIIRDGFNTYTGLICTKCIKNFNLINSRYILYTEFGKSK